jgi:two-component system sensor histidine kinase/response regulator
MDAQSVVISRCSQCRKVYQVDLSHVIKKYAKFQCKSCANWIVVENSAYVESPSFQETESEPYRADSAFDVDHIATSLETQGLSIRTKITVIFVFLVMGALSVVGLVASAKSRTALLTQAEQHLHLAATQKAKEYNLIFQRMLEEVQSVADFSRKAYREGTTKVDLDLSKHLLMPWTGKGYGSVELDKTLQGEKLILQQVVRMLMSVVDNNPYVTLGYLGTETNIMALSDLKAVDSIGSLKGYVNSKRPWYTKAKEAGETIWTEPYVDANTRDLIVTCAAPVYNWSGQLVGVVGFDVLLTTIQKDILSMDIGYNGYAMLIDTNGKVLVRPGMNRTDTRWDKTYATEDLRHTDNPAFNAIIDHMIQGTNMLESYEAGGQKKYIAYAPLSGIGASMAMVANQGEVLKPATAIQTFIIIVWGAVLVVTLVIGLVIGNNITHPIKQLSSLADRISKGEVDLEMLPENRLDEIGVLSQAFNRLIISLQKALSLKKTRSKK